MGFNSKVYLKKQDDPIIISEAGAESIKKVFLDTSISYDQPLNAGKVSFFKSEIRRVEVNPDDDKKISKKPFWIIYSPSRNTIWEKTYTSFQDAHQELLFQQGSLTEAEKANSDWRVEQR